MRKSDLIAALAEIPDEEEVVALVYSRRDFADPQAWIKDESIAFTTPDLAAWNAFVPWFEKIADQFREEIGYYVGDELLQYAREVREENE